MARGEQGARGRGAGLAIASAFGVLCLFVLWGVLATTRACDEGLTPPPPHMMTAPEPYPGAFAAAARLSTRGCRVLPPGTTPSSHRATLDQELEDRGYVADGGWSAPTVLPADAAVGGCGVVAAVADGGFITAAYVDSKRREVPCGGERVVFGSCGPDSVRLEGQGDVLIRRYLAPGLTASDLAPSGIDVDTLLAHAEAEHTLSTMGYEASDELVVERLGPLASGHFHAARPPSSPDEGCVLWVGVVSGMGNVSVSWSGVTGAGYMPHHVANDAAVDVGTFALFACGDDAGATRGDAEAAMYAPRATDPRIVYRAFAPPGPSPSAAGPPLSPTIARAREVDVSHAVLPTATDFVHPEIR